jgi:hypothetical protein
MYYEDIAGPIMTLKIYGNVWLGFIYQFYMEYDINKKND